MIRETLQLTIYDVDPGKVTSNSDAKVFVALEVVGVDVDGVREVLIVLPYVGKVYVESAPLVVLKSVLPQNPVVNVVGVPQVFGVLEDSSLVLGKSCSVDHVSDLRYVKLIQLTEWSEDEHCFRVVHNFTVKDFH